MLATTSPTVTEFDLVRLAQALVTAANTEATVAVMITPSLTEHYRAPALQTVHSIGRHHLPALVAILRAWGLPEVTYEGDCFRFAHR